MSRQRTPLGSRHYVNTEMKFLLPLTFRRYALAGELQTAMVSEKVTRDP